jgi:hypothetical protein
MGENHSYREILAPASADDLHSIECVLTLAFTLDPP